MNCIFITIFHEQKYVEMFFYLLESILVYGYLDSNTHILIYTSTEFRNIIEQSHLFNSERIKFEINDTYDDIEKACNARLDLFNLESTQKYNKILYLDTDIIIKKDINNLFKLIRDDVLYVLEEGFVDDPRDYYGKTLFGNEINNYKNKTAFTSGILLFNNCEKIKDLFSKILADIIQRPYELSFNVQPYIVYNAFKYNLYNNKILKIFAVNNDNNIHSEMTIHHFPGNPGVYRDKIKSMTHFLHNINNFYGTTELMIYDTVLNKHIQNVSFSLIGICVSYNYFDTLQFMLPINHGHFERLYIITQEDDLQTIEFCKKFINVNVLIYDFKTNNKTFDKYGALNYVQRIAYENYPDSWYLIIDSDIILPNNMIEILTNENLNPHCIYGALRNDVSKSSELLNKKNIINNNKRYIYNNIVGVLLDKPPSMVGCFQLYKKHCFHKNNYNNAGYGDFDFGYMNFDLFCNIQKLLFFHLGYPGLNWNGKVKGFNDDINISLQNICYNCISSKTNKYYNKSRQLLGNIMSLDKTQYPNSLNDIDIYDDVCTCSYKMRIDIADFFLTKKQFKIAEIGSYKGYSTKVLSKIFSKVYAVDNNVEWTEFNKNFNKEISNIEYVMLDIYNENWNILPDDIDVCFIDADHSYYRCKSDIMNSINRFKKLQYIIFDNYGVCPGVKQVIDELIQNKRLQFERFIGITDVPDPSDTIVHNVNEGIICSIRLPNTNTNTNMNKMKLMFK